MMQNTRNYNDITSTETFSTLYQYVCNRPSDYYSSNCLNCTMRNPINCKYLMVKETIRL